MLKKLFSMTTALVMTLSLVCVLPSIGASADRYGYYEYSFNDDDTAMITAYTGTASSLIIPSTLNGIKVTSIDDRTFSGNEKLSSVTIPDTITNVGRFAFYGTPMTDGQTTDVKYADKWAVYYTSNKTTPTIKSGTVGIGGGLFFGDKITKVTLPSSVKYISDQAFYSCDKLSSITLPSSLVILGSEAFDNCTKLTSLTIPNNVTDIKFKAFNNCLGLKKLTIGSKVKNIGESAFANCPELKSVTIPKNVKNIDYHAFGYEDDEYHTGRDVKIDGFTIYCYYNTAAHKYAKENGFKYVLLDKIGKVSGLKATATSVSAVKLVWKKVSGATGYIVYRAVNGKWKRVGTVTKNSFYEGKLKSGTSYRYAVRAYKTLGSKKIYSSSYPKIWTSTKPAKVNFKLTAGTGKVKITWKKVTGATGYKIYYKTSKNGKWKGLKTVSYKTTSYTKKGLARKRGYWFTVIAYRTTHGKTYYADFATKGIKTK